MRVLNFLLFYVFCANASSDDKETELEDNRKRLLDQLTKTRTVLLDDYHLVTRQIATNVNMYRSYRDVIVIFYPIMRDVIDAHFTFQSEEIHLNNIGRCDPYHVIVNLKRGAYPAVNPDGFDFPQHFVDPAIREHMHTIDLLSDGSSRNYTVANPKPGNWYALIYIAWEDPRTQKVEQQGLVPRCDTIIYTDLQVKRKEDIVLIDCYVGVTLNYYNIPAYFKCISIDNADPINLRVTVVNTTTSDSEVQLRVQALSLPTEEEYLVSCAFDPRLNHIQTVTFSPNPNAWHYIQIDRVQGNTSKIANCESYYPRTYPEQVDNVTVLDLMRDDKGRFFTFDYGLPSTDVQDATSLLNLTSNETKTLRYKINQFVDIGGTLGIEASLLMSLKYYMGYKRQIKKGALLPFTKENQFFRVVICLDIGHPSIPLNTGHCKYNDHIKPALFVLNSTDSTSIHDKTIIPFPESGMWYLTFRLFCDEVVCPCRTSHNGTKYYVNLTTEQDEDISTELSDLTREGEKQCNTTVLLSLSSTSCVGGRCSNHGSCQMNAYGAMIMSYCRCTSGFGAWDCSDGSRMDSRMSILTSILLLTLSNLLFFASIYVAIIRLYYTEAMMFTFTMVFSTFYHACDAPAQVAYCILRGNILQFGDFYSGMMSFWLMLLAVAVLGDKMRSFLQLSGAIVIAILVTWNMHNIAAFLTPVAVGAFIMLLSWFLDYRKIRKMRYPRSYYTRYLPLGLFLVAVGLVCYGFLQTEQNYKFVHSSWHMVVALSVVFLLPDARREGNVNPFLPSPNYCNLSCRRYFNRSRLTLATSNQPNGTC